MPNEKPWSAPLNYLQNSDSDDECDTVSINQKEPTIVSVPSILPQPVEQDAVPSRPSEIPVLLGSPNVPCDIQESQPMHDIIHPPHDKPLDTTDTIIESQPSIPPPSRPRRNTKPPKYLEDYVLK